MTKGLGLHPGGRRKAPPPCGTDAGYKHHWRWFEEPCAECLVAHAEAARAYRYRNPSWTERHHSDPFGEGAPEPHQGIIADLIEAGATALVIRPDGHPLVWITQRKP